MTESRETGPGDGQKGSKRLRYFVVFLLVLVVALITTRLRYQPSGEKLSPPEITTEGLPSTAAGEVSIAFDEVANAPQSAAAWGQLGMVLLAHNSDAQARECFRFAQSLDSSEFKWPYLLGVSLSASDPPAAIKPLREAVALRNDVAVAHVRLAELFLEMDQLEETRQHLDLALQSEPNNLHALIAYARLHLAHEDLDASLRSAERAVWLGSQIRSTHELLAHVYRRQGDQDAALRQLAIADTLPETPLEYNDPFAAQVSTLRNDTQPALRQAQKFLAENRFKEAIELLGPAWDNDPTDPSLACELARALAQVNQPTIAANVLDRAAQQHPTSAAVRLQRGVLYFIESDYQNAARSFGEAIERKPDHAVAYFYLGQSHNKLGDKAKAVEAFQAAVRLEPAYAAAHKILGQLFLEQRRFESAKSHLQTVLELVPGDQETQSLLNQAKASREGK